MWKRLLCGVGLIVLGWALALCFECEWDLTYHTESVGTSSLRIFHATCTPRYTTPVIELFGPEKK